MKQIVSERITKFYAIKNAIDIAISEYLKDKELFFIKVNLIWSDFNKKREEELIIRREVINQYFDIDYIEYKKRGGNKIGFYSKNDYNEFYKILKKSEEILKIKIR